MGGPVRAEVVWLPAGPWLPRRDRGDPHDGEPHRRKRLWVLDADLEAAFDRLDHDHICVAGRFPAGELVRQWLKAGVIEDGRFTPTEDGAPQGGVISPLLMNVALHGMEAAAGVRYYGSRHPCREDKRRLPGGGPLRRRSARPVSLP